MTTEVQYSEYRNQAGVRGEEHRVRKITHQRAPNVVVDHGKLKGMLQESRENCIDLRVKRKPKPLRSRS
jgi:hypothetical protein